MYHQIYKKEGAFLKADNYIMSVVGLEVATPCEKAQKKSDTWYRSLFSLFQLDYSAITTVSIAVSSALGRRRVSPSNA